MKVFSLCCAGILWSITMWIWRSPTQTFQSWSGSVLESRLESGPDTVGLHNPGYLGVANHINDYRQVQTCIAHQKQRLFRTIVSRSITTHDVIKFSSLFLQLLGRRKVFQWTTCQLIRWPRLFRPWFSLYLKHPRVLWFGDPTSFCLSVNLLI